jgi:SAM-dependent methyltransferase
MSFGLNSNSEQWARYYEATVAQPAWETVRRAIELFAAEGEERAEAQRFAVDLGCGAGRDARELLRAGWRVRAVDREPGAIEALEAATEAALRGSLETEIADLATVAIPPCDLVNASLSLPFLAPDDFWPTWQRAIAAVPIGGRLAAMLFGDRDGNAGDPTMTLVNPEAIRSGLNGFELELWDDREEDGTTALGEPHHFHRIDLVARRVDEAPSAGSRAQPT